MQKLKLRLSFLCNRRGEGTYISAAIYVLVAVFMLALIINVVSILMAKTNLDTAADQVTKQIQLAGGVTDDTDALFATLTRRIGSVTDASYTVTCDSFLATTPTGIHTGKAIQLGKTFTVTVTAHTALGGFGDIAAAQMTIISTGAGASEVYWK